MIYASLKIKNLIFFALLVSAVLLDGCSSDQIDHSASAVFDDVKAPEPARLPKLDKNSLLSDYLKYAALNNPGLEEAFHRWKAALENATVAGALPDPMFNYGYFIENVETRVGPQGHRAGLSQTFPWFGKFKLKKGIALEKADAARARYEAEKLKLFYRVKNTYYEYYYLKRAIAITGENVDILKYLEQVARTRYSTGKAGHSDMIRAQVELAKLDDRLRTLIDMEKPLTAEFNAALNRPEYMPVAEPSAPQPAIITLSDTELVSAAQESNPNLLAIAEEIEAHRKSVLLARLDYYPNLTFGVDYIFTGEAVMPTADSGKDPVMAKVMINLPVWRRKYRAREEQARKKLQAARNHLENSRNTLAQKIAMVLYSLRDSQRKVDLFRDTLIPKGKQSLKAVETAYTTGKAGFTDMIDSERVLLELELLCERSLATYAQKLAELEMLVGEDPPVADRTVE